MKAPASPRWRILVVDDDPLVCESIRWILNLDGHQVTTALTGQSAINQFQTASFDAVILDYKLPDMDGDQVAAAIRSVGPHQPILIITAYPETVASLGKLLTSEYTLIAKPFSMDELRQAVSNIITKRQALSPAAPDTPAQQNHKNNRSV
ncbi:MAG TPA: response regulator [Verrucomicrobiae bacterium]